MSQLRSGYYSEQVRKSLDELGQLLELAEQVSADLSKARSGVFRQIGFMIGVLIAIFLVVFMVVSFRPMLMDGYVGEKNILQVAGAFAAGMFFIIYAVVMFLMSLNQRKWRVEREIVADILVMVSAILDSLQHEIGSVDYTLFRMRMRRLGMSDASVIRRLGF